MSDRGSWIRFTIVEDSVNEDGNITKADFNQRNDGLVGMLETLVEEAKIGRIHSGAFVGINSSGWFEPCWNYKSGVVGLVIGGAAYLQAELTANYSKNDSFSELNTWINGG